MSRRSLTCAARKVSAIVRGMSKRPLQKPPKPEAGSVSTTPMIMKCLSLGTTENPPEPAASPPCAVSDRSEEHTSELQSQSNLVCRLLLEKKKRQQARPPEHHSALYTSVSMYQLPYISL